MFRITFSRESQPKKALSPILLTLPGLFISLIPVSLNAPGPISMTLAGKEMLVSASFPAKAYAAIIVTPAGIEHFPYPKSRVPSCPTRQLLSTR
jgi:hypothetical protein